MTQQIKNNIDNIAYDLRVELFPDLTELEFDSILWNYTGFPCFFTGDPAIILRQQLEEYKRVGAKILDEQFDLEWKIKKLNSM